MTSRILIADDNEDNLELLRFMLRNASYEVCEARDGHECLQLAREQQTDLIMIDLSMPKLNGWQVFQELQTDERTNSIPCVAVTGHSGIDRQRALQIGFRAYICKPYSSENLLLTVKQVLAPETIKASAAQSAHQKL